MKLAALMLALCLSGCAAGRINADGSIVGAALGHARLERCQRGYEDEGRQMSVEGGERCSTIRGGALSVGAADFLATAMTALGAYFGL